VALTDAQICTVALARIGQRQFVDDLNSNTSQAQVCKVLYPLARDAVLESFPWPFATRRATLGLLAGATKPGWAYVYVMPGDCVVARYLDPGTANPSADARIPFSREIADDANGMPTIPILLSNFAAAILIYTARLSNPGLWPALFTDALAWRMAADLALALAVKPELGLRMESAYAAALNAAASAQLRQLQSDVPPDSPFVRGR
jgi:hypothetical protein